MNIIQKDITTVTEGIIAHGVNCQHRMGSGVAKAIYTKWPEVREKYMEIEYHILGMVQIVEINDNLIIENCHTQWNYGYDGKKYADLDGIRSCMIKVARDSLLYELPIYVPMIGCGLAGRDWETEVKPIVLAIEEQYGVEFNVCVI